MNNPSNKVLIVSQTLGTFLCRTEEGSIWSNQSDSIGFEAAPTFDKNQAGRYLSMWSDTPTDLKYVEVCPDYEDDYATPLACAVAGAPTWLSLSSPCANYMPI